MNTEESTSEGDNNNKSKDSSEHAVADEHKDTVKKNGRFKSVRVDGAIPPSQSSASLISSICSQLNEYYVADHVLPDPTTESEKNSQTQTPEKEPQPIEEPLTFTAKTGRLFEPRPKNGKIPENTVPPSVYNACNHKSKENEGVGFLQKLRNWILSVLRNPKAFGFQHICLLVLVLAYTLLGATLFFFIESNYENKYLFEIRQIKVGLKLKRKVRGGVLCPQSQSVPKLCALCCFEMILVFWQIEEVLSRSASQEVSRLVTYLHAGDF
ncbi:hypothetical protein Y032_0105g3707 [Ancylostoma ceylanicum]|uniref:Uncharacterized protein n=1 Tax=Ancylostoma ceylanicum TaxID=53326 RepID=A0A016TG90_9BILA|nr:hypothetical protein Y032_0105g3707 [Ancylostoma ceylanicum]